MTSGAGVASVEVGPVGVGAVEVGTMVDEGPGPASGEVHAAQISASATSPREMSRIQPPVPWRRYTRLRWEDLHRCRIDPYDLAADLGDVDIMMAAADAGEGWFATDDAASDELIGSFEFVILGDGVEIGPA